MMRILKILFLIIFSVSIFAQNPRLSKDEFLKMYDKGKIKFDVMPLGKQLVQAQLMKISKISKADSDKIELSMLTAIEKELIQMFKATYSYFQPEMMNVRYIDDGVWRYSISFDFATTRKCILRVDKLNMECGNPICSSEETDPTKHSNVDYKGVVIDEKYCEKAYNIKIKK